MFCTSMTKWYWSSGWYIITNRYKKKKGLKDGVVFFFLRINGLEQGCVLLRQEENPELPNVSFL